jgi:glycosyltransferase involved in cell wall biosynthesis
MKFPKLLVATEFAPNAPGGGPAVVRQMLRGYPADKIAWWSCFPEGSKKFGQDVATHYCAKLPSSAYPYKRWKRIKALALSLGWAPLLGRHLERTIQAAQPEVIWAIPHNWAIPPLHRVLTQGKTPYHVTMQDYVDIHDHPERFGKKQCERMAQMADSLYKEAWSRDATSLPMMEDLERRTGAKAAQMLHAGLEEEDFSRLSQDVTETQILRIAYAGSVLVSDEFALFIKALRIVREKTGMPVQIELFGANPFERYRWYDKSWMNSHGNLAEEALGVALRNCTLGFIPMALHDHEPRYNRFSFPTKYISYLAAGIPPVVLAHPESSVARMATEYQTGFYSSTADPNALAEELIQFLKAPVLKARYRSAILKCAKENFSASAMRERLWECFRADAARL